MKNWKIWIVVACLQALFAMYLENSRLRWELRLSEKTKKIADDQISELMYTNSTIKAEMESVATRNYTAGVVDAINNRDHFNAIWHDGYNRGENTAKLEKEIKKTVATSDH